MSVRFNINFGNLTEIPGFCILLFLIHLSLKLLSTASIITFLPPLKINHLPNFQILQFGYWVIGIVIGNEGVKSEAKLEGKYQIIFSEQ